MRRVLLIAALVLAVLVDGFFALVNFYPVAPPQNRGPRRYVLAEMDPEQAAWFQENMLDEYNDEHDTNLVLRAVEEEHLADGMNATDVVLVALPSTRAAEVAAAGHAAPFDGAIAAARLARDFAGVRPEVVRSARHGGRQYFLPRAIVLDVAVYRISRVRDAMLHWQLVRREIDAAVRGANGRGLPAGYTLEQQPQAWDAYDQFVLAYYWAHRAYGGKPARARVAHRTGLGIDAQLEIAAAVYRAGGSDATLATRDATPSLDWFQWEALYRAEGLYADEMFAPGGLDDEGTLDALERGDFYLTTLDQMEAFSLHGDAHRGAQSLVEDEDDLGFVAMPRFSSLALDGHGTPLRRADGFSFREEAVWVLPKHSPDPGLAYELVRWVMDRENHARECEALGMLPMRPDVVRERATLFRAPWMQDVFAAGLAQWPRAEMPPPTLQDAFGTDYAVAWDRIVAQRGASAADRAGIATLLRAPVDRTAAARAVEADEAAAHEGSPSPTTAEVAGGESFAVAPLREPVVLQGLDGGPGGGR